jgi:hypothetical protein
VSQVTSSQETKLFGFEPDEPDPFPVVILQFWDAVALQVIPAREQRLGWDMLHVT